MLVTIAIVSCRPTQAEEKQDGTVVRCADS